MRGSDMRTGELFSYVDIEDRVPSNHPLRLIRRIVNDVLASLGACMRPKGGLRLHPSGCYGRFCCRHFTPFARSGS